MSELIHNSEYKTLICELKSQIQSAQIKAAVAVNHELLKLYWLIAEQIVQKQQAARWGDGLVKQVSRDLQQEYPNMKGFSVRNLELIRKWYRYWTQTDEITQQVVSQLDQAPIFQIPWGQNLLIISKSSSPEEALFYVQKTIENNWSRAVLTHQIEWDLYQRQGKALSNFDNHLPTPQSDLAKQTLKDPYCFDFMTLTVLHWIPVFARPETVEILFNSLRYLMTEGLKINAYVILENHLHLIAQSKNIKPILEQLTFYKKAHKGDRQYQFWQEGVHPEWIQNEAMMRQKIDYIHHNPIKRGYVDQAEHWRYSSARNYAGEQGMLEVSRQW